jgi:nucleotide-binding universal stress UspA family protein
VLVAARGYDPIEKALFAFDCTPNGLKAVEAATASPLLRDGLPVELVYAGEDTGAARGALDRAASELREEGVTVTTRIVPGPPETAIPEIVAREGVGLLVMGAFGHTRLHSLVLGSTTSQLMRACKIPVLLFR